MSFVCVILTGGSICQGYEDAPAIKYIKNDSGETIFANFKIGIRVYDSNAEGSYRYENWRIEASGDAMSKIQRLNLKPGSRVDIVNGTLTQKRFSIDGTEHNQTVIRIKNADSIRYSDSGYYGDKKEDKVVEPDTVVPADNYFKVQQPQMVMQPQMVQQQPQMAMQPQMVQQQPQMVTQQPMAMQQPQMVMQPQMVQQQPQAVMQQPMAMQPQMVMQQPQAAPTTTTPQTNSFLIEDNTSCVSFFN